MPQPTSRRVPYVPMIAGVAVVIVILAAAFTLTVAKKNRDSSLSVTAPSMGGSAGVAYGRAEMQLAEDGAVYDKEAYYAGTPSSMPSPMPPEWQTGGDTAADVDQKIIKSGSLRLTVDSVGDTVTKIGNIADRSGGFVQNSSTSERGDGTHDGEISIRVPSKDFSSTMAEVKTLAKVVNFESANGQDVTEQYTDLEAQLRNAKAQEEEFLRIMKQARNVEEILKVQAQLGNVRGQIESLQGRLKYLTNVTSLSTIHVSLTEETVVKLPTKEFRPGAIFRDAVQELIMVGQAAVAGLIWLVIVGGGVLLPLLALGWLVWAVVRKMRA